MNSNGDEFKAFNDLIINEDFVDKIEKLNTACELLKSSELLRQNIDEKFYELLYSRLIDSNYSCEKHVILFKLLRNAYGTIKNDFTAIEIKLCELLIEQVNSKMKIKEIVEKNNENYRNCIVFILQYFANLIQGNC